jgi:hypothetical protein
LARAMAHLQIPRKLATGVGLTRSVGDPVK